LLLLLPKSDAHFVVLLRIGSLFVDTKPSQNSNMCIVHDDNDDKGTLFAFNLWPQTLQLANNSRTTDVIPVIFRSNTATHYSVFGL